MLNLIESPLYTLMRAIHGSSEIRASNRICPVCYCFMDYDMIGKIYVCGKCKNKIKDE